MNILFDDQAYYYAYNYIQQNCSYDLDILANYTKFKEFCEKDLSNITEINKLFMHQYIECKKIASNKICEYYLAHNSQNKPITYLKFTYKKMH